MKTTLLLIRHGQSTSNVDHTFAGQTDVPLSDLGRRQAEATAEFLKDTHIDAFYSSDLSRAYDTGLAIAKYHDKPVIPNTHLREVFCGEWEAMPRDELIARYPETYDTWKNDIGHIQLPGGENAGQVQARVYSFLDAVGKTHPGKTVCITTHAFAIRCFITKVLELPLERMQEQPWATNASITTVTYESGKFTLEEYSYDAHMGSLVTAWKDK